MSNGAGWDEADIERDIAEVDWAAELSDITDKQTIADDAMHAVGHWLQLPAHTAPPSGGKVSRGDVIWSVYMRALAKVHGYPDWQSLNEDNHELTALYREIIVALLANGVIINTETEQVLASERVLAFLNQDADTDGDR
jgi:hypothetical protein